MFVTWIIVMILLVGGLTFIGWQNIQRNGRYFELEKSLRLAAESYFNNYTERLSGESIVSKETLIYEEFLGNIDEELTSCIGYVIATPRVRSHLFKSYVKCENYTTRGFNQEYLEKAW